MTFSQQLALGFAAQRRLCVGIDPHRHLLADWQLADTAAGAEYFGMTVVDAAADVALAVKPQVAFFERFGSAGFIALERIFAHARSAGVPVIADVKRGDIGSTFAAYAAAWLTPGAPLEADAITVHPYHGFASLTAGLELALEHGKGVFVLAATSNPEAARTQQALCANGFTVAAENLHAALAYNQSTQAAQAAVGSSNVASNVGAVGVVLGATVNLAEFGIATGGTLDPQNPVLPILAPGFGAQGAQLDAARRVFGEYSAGVIPNESRGVLVGGKSALRQRILDRAAVVTEGLG